MSRAGSREDERRSSKEELPMLNGNGNQEKSTMHMSSSYNLLDMAKRNGASQTVVAGACFCLASGSMVRLKSNFRISTRLRL